MKYYMLRVHRFSVVAGFIEESIIHLKKKIIMKPMLYNYQMQEKYEKRNTHTHTQLCDYVKSRDNCT
jgi:hypothetical protein